VLLKGGGRGEGFVTCITPGKITNTSKTIFPYKECTVSLASGNKFMFLKAFAKCVVNGITYFLTKIVFSEQKRKMSKVNQFYCQCVSITFRMEHVCN
jgi:hypothetical protein